jgi:GNAT superfamily N-acetyltransferase
MFDIENDIRIADTDDFQELFRVCCLLHRENGQHEFSEPRSSAFIWRGCNKDNAVIGVIGPSDNIKAIIYLEVQQIYYSQDYQLYEAFAFVRPDCRKTDYAKRLLRFAKKCSDDTGLDLLIGIISDTRLAGKARLYDRELPRGGVFYNYRQPKSDIGDTA